MTANSAWIAQSTDTARLDFERDAVAAGRCRVAGVDEAGRGPLAGPIVAAAVVLAAPIPGVDDSKRLTGRKREALFDAILAGGHGYGIAVVDAITIDEIGIQRANYRAMIEAAAAIPAAPDFLLVDGFMIQGCATPQVRIVKGDQRSQSIAAASVLAKVTRDRIMIALAEQYPEYGFERHKGYGTKAHIAAIEQHGPCPAHRTSFAPIATRYESGVLFR